MRRALLLPAVFFGATCSPAAEQPESPTLQHGREVYAQYCALCHGANGEGYAADAANALSNPEFLAIASDTFLTEGIKKGRPGTSMSAWGSALGGPLSDSDVAAVVALIRSFQVTDAPDLSKYTVTGQAQRGLPIYEARCENCHGKGTQPGSYMTLNNPQFLANASDAYLKYSILKGRPQTPMAGYEATLLPQGIDDLVALIRSWQTEANETAFTAPSFKPDEVIMHEGGPQPDFQGDGRYVSVDVVNDAMEGGKAFVMLDARPPSDYVASHISGALSAPFYAIPKLVPSLPKDHWIVTYCGCPHAESGQAADKLLASGFTKVRVLDEGFFVWKSRGYPFSEGASP